MYVGIGVLAQPQLVVWLYDHQKQTRIEPCDLIGGVFYHCDDRWHSRSDLSNAYFADYGAELTAVRIKTMDAEKGFAVLQIMKPNEQVSGRMCRKDGPG